MEEFKGEGDNKQKAKEDAFHQFYEKIVEGTGIDHIKLKDSEDSNKSQLVSRDGPEMEILTYLNEDTKYELESKSKFSNGLIK